jgi:hypothetical protein
MLPTECYNLIAKRNSQNITILKLLLLQNYWPNIPCIPDYPRYTSPAQKLISNELSVSCDK